MTGEETADEDRVSDLLLDRSGTDVVTPAPPPVDRKMLEALVCPKTHMTLSYDAARQELISHAAGLAYPIRNGIPVMLADEARTLD